MKQVAEQVVAGQERGPVTRRTHSAANLRLERLRDFKRWQLFLDTREELIVREVLILEEQVKDGFPIDALAAVVQEQIDRLVTLQLL